MDQKSGRFWVLVVLGLRGRLRAWLRVERCRTKSFRTNKGVNSQTQGCRVPRNGFQCLPLEEWDV